MCSDRDGWVSKKIPISAEGGEASGSEDFATRRRRNGRIFYEIQLLKQMCICRLFLCV